MFTPKNINQGKKIINRGGGDPPTTMGEVDDYNSQKHQTHQDPSTER